MKRTLVTAVALLAAGAANAVQVCELNGQHVNPANGATTAGKSGLMRCREGESGPVVREQELRNGRFMGIVRYYKDGALEREYSVNERGNRDGLAREFAAARSGENRVLREETFRDGTTIGILRTWHPNGGLRRVSFHGEDGREGAVAELNPAGQLTELRCAARPQLAPHVDDAKFCGHEGTPAPVTLRNANGQVVANVTFERGELRLRESVWTNGKPRQLVKVDVSGGSETSFGETGTKRREVEWTHVPSGGDSRPRRVTTLDREFHESGTLVRERRFTPPAGDLAAEARWYLNGQPREKRERVAIEGRAAERETIYHDNGKPSSEGDYLLGARSTRTATGVHKHYDDSGRLRREAHYDARGRINREREWDANGRLERDEALFEDGSRKAFSR